MSHFDHMNFPDFSRFFGSLSNFQDEVFTAVSINLVVMQKKKISFFLSHMTEFKAPLCCITQLSGCARLIMPLRHISPDLKQHAVWLKNNGWLTGNICHILGISDDSLRRWCQNVEQFGHVIPPHNPLQGRPSTLDAFQVHELIEVLCETPELFLDEIRDWVLLSQDVGLSQSAIHKIIEDLGFTYKYLKKVAVEHDGDAHRQWMEGIHAEFVAEQMVFVDESSKDD